MRKSQLEKKPKTKNINKQKSGVQEGLYEKTIGD